MNFYDDDDALYPVTAPVAELVWDDDENAHKGFCNCPRCVAMEMDY